MASVLEIVRGISQAMSNTHDGALDENGDPVVIGLRREEEVAITDKRIVDGFSIRFIGEKLCVYYNSEITMKEVHDKGFENEMAGYIDAAVKHIKKEYKSAVGEALTLTKDGEIDVLVQNMRRVRSWVVAKQDFKIGGFEKAVDVMENESPKIDTAIKNWLRMGKDVGEGAKKNQADSRKKSDQ